jgi:hypothetical protein
MVKGGARGAAFARTVLTYVRLMTHAMESGSEAL